MTKILIVDDEPNILLSLEFLMKKQGYQVFIARDGQEAMELIKKEGPEVIILDIMMPDVDGYQVCEFVKKTPQYAETRIIFLSAKSKEADIELGYEYGADLYISKPFSTRKLVSSVKELVLNPTK